MNLYFSAYIALKIFLVFHINFENCMSSQTPYLPHIVAIHLSHFRQRRPCCCLLFVCWKKCVFFIQNVTPLTEHSSSQGHHILLYISLCSFHRNFWLFCSLISPFSWGGNKLTNYFLHSINTFSLFVVSLIAFIRCPQFPIRLYH